MQRRWLAIGAVALTLLLGIGLFTDAGVLAQVTGTPAPGESTSASKRDTYLAALAARLGISQDELESAIQATNDELGIEGRLGHGRGGGHRHGPDGNRPGGIRDAVRSHLIDRADLADAAAFLGMTEDQLKTALEDSTFLEIAEAQGKTIEDVRAFLITQATERIDQRLSEAQADASATSGGTESSAAPATSPTATTSA